MRTSLRSHLLIAGLVLTAALCAAVPAVAAGGGAAVIADCNAHNTLTGSYSIAALEKALQTMPADIAEYSACKDVITRQLLAQEGKLHLGGASTSGSSGGSFLPTWVIVVLVVLALAAATLGAMALRHRRGV